MPFRLRTSIAAHLFSSMMIIYIAVGVSVVHPLMHEHTAHGHDTHDTLDQCAHHAHEAIQQEENHVCPICDFLATNPFHPIGSGLSADKPWPISEVASMTRRLSVKTFLNSDEPRGPPLSI